MKTTTCEGIGITLMVGAALALTAAAGRVGGSADIEYESLNAGGAAYATAGVFKVGGSLGQGGFVRIGTNASAQVLGSGFWKPEDGCDMYPTAITNLLRTGSGMAVTFTVMLSNTYHVVYLNKEGGGLLNGVHVWTNSVASLMALSGIGGSTTVVDNITAATNAARFYMIRCE